MPPSALQEYAMTKDEIKLAYTQAMQWVQEAGDYLRQAMQEGFSVNHKA